MHESGFAPDFGMSGVGMRIGDSRVFSMDATLVFAAVGVAAGSNGINGLFLGVASALALFFLPITRKNGWQSDWHDACHDWQNLA